MKKLILVIAASVIAFSCSSTPEVNTNTVNSANSANENRNTNADGNRTAENSSSPEANLVPGVKTVDPLNDGWQVIVPQEKDFVRERQFAWQSTGGQKVDVLIKEHEVSGSYILESPDKRAKLPQFDGPFQVEILAELTVEETVFGYRVWVRGVGGDDGTDPKKAAERRRLVTFRIFDYEGDGRFEPARSNSDRVPQWVLNKQE
ncbi:MAG: hypothetical protein DWQ47_05200 [Acidobacteria bacterium]|nr:MAG: hypothetical protein DWQ32_08750 [Acidobacteriota bacterium]REK01779.1 MAG: hypothetical protein DWQ38_05185 [Acidobacteriota bacterium]REK14735.1 MAG: hypothetical protein DWQ43_14440 [Acidobacteriota bacterium]REK45450.1 MAG: hypothetical protein DWQ47_05200 [Acidobacteriota bacterium]